MQRFTVAATKRRRNDKRSGPRAFERRVWQADGPRAALTIALALKANGWNVTRIRETVPVVNPWL